MYSFEINIGSLSTPVKGGGYIVVNPLTTDNGIVKKRDSENFYKVRKDLKSELVFTGDEYRALVVLRDNEDKFIELKIYDGVNLSLYGYLLFSGTWDENKNQCSMQFQVVDQYSELEQNLDVEQNIVQLAKHSVYITQNSIVYEVTLPCFDGSRVEAKLYYDPDGEISQDPGTQHPDWTYYLDNGEVPGCPETFEYSYKFITTYVTFAHPDYVKSEIFAEWYLKAASSSEVATLELDTGIKEFDILDALLTKADSTLTASKANYSTYINDTGNEIYNMFFFDKSDVKRYSEGEPATREIMKLGDMLNLYSRWFNLFYNIDDSKNFTLKFIDDLTEANYTLYPAHDLTNFKGKEWTEQQKRYNTDVENKSSKEILSHEIESSFFNYGLYFDNIKEWAFSTFNNDVGYLVSDPTEVQDDGMCVVTCDNTDTVINKTPGAIELINPGMFPGNLLYDHVRNANRPYSSADQGSTSVALTKEKDKEVLYKNLPIYNVDELDFDYFVKIGLGLAIPYEIEISFDRDWGKLIAKL